MGAPESAFYVTGGTLRADAACYIERQADRDLLAGLLQGEFCYVLTSRQMGKSSLMVRTANKLREQHVQVAVLDLTAIGQNLTPEQWYDGLIVRLGQQLHREEELEDFWDKHRALGPCQRFFAAIREVVLGRATPGLPDTAHQRVVLCVDELDVVRSLPFSTDEFFAAIRECYNRRLEEPPFYRVAFCLLGVASPTDLIRDTRLTPFNIGRRIELNDFTAEEAAPLAAGLRVRNGEGDQGGTALLQRVLYWTNGHPYLTQRLCLAVAADGEATLPEAVDQFCEELFFSSRAKERDDNLLFVRERLLRSEVDLAGLLTLYANVIAGKRVPDDESNPLVSVLRLSGILCAQQGQLQVRNQIYRKVFEKAWVETNMPDAEIRRQKAAFRRGLARAAGVAAVIVGIIATLGALAVRQARRAEAGEAKARQNAYASDMNLAQQALQVNNLGRTRQLLQRHMPRPGQVDLRGWEWRYLWRRCQGNDLRTLCEVPTAVRSLSLSTDGANLAIAEFNGTVSLWDTKTGSELRKLQTFQSFYSDDSAGAVCAFSPDEHHLAASSKDEKERWVLRIWEVPHMTETSRLPTTSFVRWLAYSPSGRHLAAFCLDSTVRVWDMESTNPAVRFPCSRGRYSEHGLVAFAPKGNLLAIGESDGEVQLIDLSSLQTILRFRAHGQGITALAFSTDSQLLATGAGYSEKQIKLWRTDRGIEAGELSGHAAWISGVAFSPGGKVLASTSADQTVRLWNAGTTQQLATLRGHLTEIYALSFSLHGNLLATGSKDGVVKLWDVAQKQPEEPFLVLPELVRDLAFSPDSKTFATLSRTRTVAIWELAALSKGGKVLDMGTNGSTLTYAPDGRLVVGRLNGIVTIWDPGAERVLNSFTAHTNSLVFLRLLPQGNVLVTTEPSGTVKCWDARAWHETNVGHLPTLWSQELDLEFSPDHSLIAFLSPRETVTIWSIPEAKELLSFRASKTFVQGLAFSPNGEVLVSGGGDGLVRVWNATTFKLIETLRGHLLGIHALAFSPDGKRLATASGDKETVKLWTTQTYEEVGNLEGQGELTRGVWFSPDGNTLLVIHVGGKVNLWRAPSFAEIEAAEQAKQGMQ